MTVAELESLAKRIRFCGLFRDMRLEVGTGPVSVVIQASLSLPHRDTGNVARLYFREVLAAWDIETFDERDGIDWLHSFVRRFALHEIDEAFLVDGHRPFDPHARAYDQQLDPRSREVFERMTSSTNGRPMNSGRDAVDDASTPPGLVQTNTASSAGPQSGACTPDQDRPAGPS